MRRANGTGTFYKMPGNRRNPWVARKDKKIIGYYKTAKEAEKALNQYIENKDYVIETKDSSDMSYTFLFNEGKANCLLRRYEAIFDNIWQQRNWKWYAIMQFEKVWKPATTEDMNLSSMFCESVNLPINTEEMSEPGTYNQAIWDEKWTEVIADKINNNRENFNKIFTNGLFDEGKDLVERISAFKNEVDIDIDDCVRAASILLWLRYPDKYYISNSYEENIEICKNFCDNFPDLFISENRSCDEVIIYMYFYEVCDKIHACVIKDDFLISKFKEKIDDSDNYADPEFITLTSDFGYTTLSFVFEAHNTLVYGIPGVGKSTMIDNRIANDECKGEVERIVFYPDYSYSDFVGQILPKSTNNGEISYPFIAGPFTRMLKKAYEDPFKMHYLIIEELNRGNAPAIFGDVFQLLDRNENGDSKYAIENENISEKVYGVPNLDVVIPGNMTIYATMNTSDQNVFTMDTAFQRRWELEFMPNDPEYFEDEDIQTYAIELMEKIIEGTDISWGTFLYTINNKILELNEGMLSMEDKRLGVMFISKDELGRNKFPQKVLKYLWDDAFKMNREKVFKENIKSMEDIIVSYMKEDPFSEIFLDGIF